MENLTAHKKPALSFWQIWNMSFGFMGIQFGWALQMANMSSIYSYLGANADDIPLLWLAAPITGLIVQPIIGYLSDRTWHPFWGRRRPYFLIGAILSSCALIMLPNSSSLWMAAGLLWILDSSINISMEPFRAFVADKLPEEQRTFGFSMQSLFIGLGSVIASALPWIFTNWVKLKDPDGYNGIPINVKWSFYIGAFAFFSFVLYTILTSKEYPPVIDDVPSKNKKSNNGFREILQSIKNMPGKMRSLALVQFLTWPGLFLMWFYYTPTVGEDVYKGTPQTPYILEISNLTQSCLTEFNEKKKEKISFEVVFKKISEQKNDSNNTINKRDMLLLAEEYVEKVSENERPKELQNCITNNKLDSTLFYYKLSHSIFADNKLLETTLRKSDTTRIKDDILFQLVDNKLQERYKKGQDFAGLTYSFQNLITFLFALFIPLMARRWGKKLTHQLCLTLGGLGLIALQFAILYNNHYLLLFTMAGVGIAWSSILSMPYSMLSDCIPHDKVGIYMGIFNFFIVLPEIIAALTFGWIMQHWLGNNTLLAVQIGGGMLILAGLICYFFVKEDRN